MKEMRPILQESNRMEMLKRSIAKKYESQKNDKIPKKGKKRAK